MTRKTAAVICPGRGTYTKTELGYLHKHRPSIGPFLGGLDHWLKERGEPSVSELDNAAKFSLKTHTPGEFASTLIYACSAADFMAIDRDRFEIVAVTGNSMGWYTALALAGAVRGEQALQLIHGMGSMMKKGVIGGQLIYPLVDSEWRRDPKQVAVVEKAIADVGRLPGAEVHASIHFGGYAILGGNELALGTLMKALPSVEDGKYPFILVNHAAFHTPLMQATSEQAYRDLGLELFERPDLPLVDGRGVIWQPYSTDLSELRDYTLGHQVVATYDFSRALTVTLKEFAPDVLILLGPGTASGGAIGQTLVENHWWNITSKADFSMRQSKDPVLLAMGREEQFKMAATIRESDGQQSDCGCLGGFPE